MKLLVIFIIFVGNLALQWYAFTAGKIAESGEVLGIKYESIIMGSTLFSIKYLWLLLLVNIGFAYGAKEGVNSFGSVLTFVLLWMAAAPIAALIVNGFIGKESVNYLHIIGIVLIFAGSIFVSANKEILELIK